MGKRAGEAAMLRDALSPNMARADTANTDDSDSAELERKSSRQSGEELDAVMLSARLWPLAACHTHQPPLPGFI